MVAKYSSRAKRQKGHVRKLFPDKRPKFRGRNSERALVASQHSYPASKTTSALRRGRTRMGSRPLSASEPAAQTPADVQPNTLVEESERLEQRLRAAWADLKDAIDGRHGHGAKAQRIERAAADEIASICGRLRVLVRYLRQCRSRGAPGGGRDRS